MSESSAIEWTDSSWNPTTGCTRVSAGCDNCYAERMAKGLLSNTYRQRLPVVNTAENRSDPFAVRIWPDRLNAPLSWQTPRKIFVNSMSDLFHRDIPRLFARQVFEVMLRADWHVYQVLTKRPARAATFVAEHADLFSEHGLPAHIWIGTSVEDQDVDYRIRHLLNVRASVRFLSCEPLIGPLTIRDFLDGESDAGIHWVIAGGESGVNARPLKPRWVRTLRDECQAYDVPFFFKQWGGRTAKAGGRTLDGTTWDEYPKQAVGI